jgi:UDP-N-acetylmuramoylalanine--D-glutamate ligase
VDFEQADLIVVSPGVPNFARLVHAEQAGVEVIGELELASRLLTAPIIAVGGTNGKSTTTTLIAELMVADGKQVFAGGNLGQPASEAVGKPFDCVVLEVSSFQLERAPRFHPRVSVLLNITEDHLDRYSSFAEYANAKGNAFVNQTPNDVAIVPSGDALCLAHAQRGRGRIVTFGPNGDYAVAHHALTELATGHQLDWRQSPMHGAHNHLNLAAAVAAVRTLGVGWDAIARGLASFEPLAHRMQVVGSLNGVHFYDDSKGTNVGACVTALRGLNEAHAVLIAGGRDKLGDYAPLVDALRERGRALVLIGEAAPRIAAAVQHAVPVVQAVSMAEAVRIAVRLAQPGDAVLLSPACSSFDMFKDYKHRGEVFTREVLSVIAEASPT